MTGLGNAFNVAAGFGGIMIGRESLSGRGLHELAAWLIFGDGLT
jgi:hypothetical protein